MQEESTHIDHSKNDLIIKRDTLVDLDKDDSQVIELAQDISLIKDISLP
jgi:hypothetical protein